MRWCACWNRQGTCGYSSRLHVAWSIFSDGMGYFIFKTKFCRWTRTSKAVPAGRVDIRQRPGKANTKDAQHEAAVHANASPDTIVETLCGSETAKQKTCQKGRRCLGWVEVKWINRTPNVSTPVQTHPRRFRQPLHLKDQVLALRGRWQRHGQNKGEVRHGRCTTWHGADLSYTKCTWFLAALTAATTISSSYQTQEAVED